MAIWIFAFYAKKCLEMTELAFLDQFLYSIWFFDTHIAMVYDILCHTVYAIKCHNMAFYDILWH